MRIALLALAWPLLAQEAASAPMLAPAAAAALPAFSMKDTLNRHTTQGFGATALAERGFLHFLAGQADKGEALLAQALQLAPTKPGVLRLAAAAWLTAGQPEKAFALHDRLLQVAPKADDEMAWAAGDLAQAGFPEKADALMERAYQLDPKDKDETLAFAMVAFRSGHHALATKWLTRVQGMDKSDAKQEGMMAFQELLGAGAMAEASALADRLLLVLTRDWAIALAVARGWLRAGNADQALVWMKRADAMAPAHPTAMIELGLLAQGRPHVFRD